MIGPLPDCQKNGIELETRPFFFAESEAKNMRKRIVLISSMVFLPAFLAGAAVFAQGRGEGLSASLSMFVRNDKPGPVDIRVEGWDLRGDLVLDEVMSWDRNNNTFSPVTIAISKQVRVVRLTFINDFFAGPGDLDRNAFIDRIRVNTIVYEAENPDRTGGTDPVSPGCGVADFIDAGGPLLAAACLEQGGFVEFDLHPGNPNGPFTGVGEGVGPKR